MLTARMTDPTPAPALGHADLDRQHREVFERLNEATRAMDGTRATATAAVERFADTLVGHLAAEEALMDASAFPEAARHKAAHELFHTDFRQLQAELAEKGPTPDLADWLRVRVAEWLRFHILVNDARLTDHLARHPVPPEGAPRARAVRRS
jgi:hemerythrin-like metal-binding protein